MNRRLAAFGAALFCLSILPAAGRADDQATALLAKHRAFAGWQFGDGSLHTFRITGSITNERGKRTDDLAILRAGLVFNDADTDVKRGGVTEHVGFTGNLFWRSDASGFTIPVYGNLAKYEASLSVLWDEGTTELPATYQRAATIDGQAVGVVRVTLASADPIDLYVNQETGAYVQAVVDPDGAYETTIHILKYAEALPGKKIISSYRVDDSKDVTTYDKIDANATIDPGELHPPAAGAYWSFTNQDPVPIKLTHDRILIDLSINGVNGRFILDTGADGIYLNDKFADRAKTVALQGGSTAASIYEEVPIRMRKVDTLTFGGATLHNVIAASQNFDRDDSRGLDWEGYDGLIGFDFFAGAIVKLDTYASKVTVLDPSTDVSTAQGVPVIVDLSAGTPAVPMMLNKTIDVNALLDTGNPGLVLFGPDLRKKRHLNIYGCGNFDRLELGPIVYASQAACEWGFAGNYILLGYDFLKHFDILFDYPHGRMLLTPNKN